jgi:hypothetical protein
VQKSLVGDAVGEHVLGEMSDSGSEIDWEAEERKADLEESGSREVSASCISCRSAKVCVTGLRFRIAKGWLPNLKPLLRHLKQAAKAAQKASLNLGSLRRKGRRTALTTNAKRKSRPRRRKRKRNLKKPRNRSTIQTTIKKRRSEAKRKRRTRVRRRKRVIKISGASVTATAKCIMQMLVRSPRKKR